MREKQKHKGTPPRTKRLLIMGIFIGIAFTSLVIGLGNYFILNTILIEDDTAITTWLNISIPEGEPQVQDIAISPDGASIATLYTLGDSSNVVIHSISPKTRLPTQQVAQLQADGVYHDLEWSSLSQRIILASDDVNGNSTVRSISFDGNEWTFAGNFISVASDDGLLAVSYGSLITFYDSNNGQLISNISLESPTTHLALSPDAQWLSYVVADNEGENGDLYVITTTPHSQDQTTSPVQSNRVWNHHYTDVISVPQGDRILLLSEKEEDWLVNHNIELAGATTAHFYEDDHVHTFAVGGYHRAVALNNMIQLYQYQQREGWTTLQWVEDGVLNVGNVEHMTFTADASYLYTVDDDYVALWNIESGTMIDQWALFSVIP